MRSSSIKVRPPVGQLEVSDDVKPIDKYVTDCLDAVSKQALIKLGNNGGYIELTNLKISPIPYRSDVLVFEPSEIPYWYYLKTDCNDPSKPFGCLQSKKPPLCDPGIQCALDSNGDNSIESQLNKYVEDNLDSCINDFAPLTDLFDIRPGKLKANTEVLENSVQFEINYPLDITVKGSNKRTTITNFLTEQNVKLKQIYELGSEIYQAEMQYNFLETTTLNLITVYSGLDEKLLPPMSSIEVFTAGKKYWIRSDVKDKLMNDILPYISMIQIVNAANARGIYSRGTDANTLPYEDGLYKSLSIKVSNNTYPDINANIIYPYSDIYLKIGDSEIIKPQSMEADSMVMKLIGFFLNDYNFKYDLSYPVIVRLSDPEAFNGEGYTFNFAMESNIRQNIPMKGNITIINAGGQTQLDIGSDSQRVNRTVTIESIDEHTKKPIDGVIIYYRCGNQYTMGQTAFSGETSSLTTQFPYCPVGGQITYEKPGYMGGGIDFNNDEGDDAKFLSIELWPLQEKTIRIYKRTPANIQSIKSFGPGAIALYSTQVTNISAKENVMLSIAREKLDPLDTDVPVVGFMVYKQPNATITTVSKDEQKAQIQGLFNDGKITADTRDSLLAELDSAPDNTTQIVSSDEQNYTLEFVPGRYDLEAFMIYNGPVHVDKETRKFCPVPKILGICIGGEKSIDLPEQNFDSWIDGGAQIGFTLNENDVYSDKNILNLYVLEMPLPTNWDMLENYQTPDVYQQGKTFLVKPVLTK